MLSVRYSVKSFFFLFYLLAINISCACGTNETEIPIDDIIARIRQEYNDYKKDKEQLVIDRQTFNEEKELIRSIDKTDVIHLNVGGEIIATTRQTLTSLPESLFSILFNGRWERRAHIDDDGNIFFDFNPIVFRHLLDQLQLSQDNSILPPSDPSLVRIFEKMMKKLRLQRLLSTKSNKNILTVNVNGQMITTRTSEHMLSPSTHSKFFNKEDVFIDYHPKIFRRFIKFQREKKVFPQLMLNNCTNLCFLDKRLSILTMPENNLGFQSFANELKLLTNKYEQRPKLCNGHVHAAKFQLHYGDTGLEFYVDTSHCRFTSTPIYLTSLTGSSNHWHVVGISSIYDPTATGFKIYFGHINSQVSKQEMLKMSIDNKWTFEWIGIEMR